jgi:desulfoferrodoxin-like iron-binding protein
MKIFRCEVCGHLEFNGIPEKCPVCWSEKEKFAQYDKIFEESQAKSPEAEVKHVPFVQVNTTCGLIPDKGCTDILVRIGKTLHPSEEKHFIQFIDCYQNERYLGRAILSPGIYPAACFHLKESTGKVTITEHCNLHGYWKTEIVL